MSGAATDFRAAGRVMPSQATLVLPAPRSARVGDPGASTGQSRRLPDWPERLAAYIDARRRQPFAWGQQDCALFAADAVLAITGRDLARPWRGRYRSAAGAARILREQGGLHGMADDALPRLPHVGQAQRGDLLLVDIDGVLSLGVVTGAGYWCGPGREGLVFRRLADAVAGWRV